MDTTELKNSPTILAFEQYFKNLNRTSYTTSNFQTRQFFKKKIFNINYSLTVQTKRFHVTKPDLRGYNKFYEQHRSKTYLFELADHPTSINQFQVTIHTNDKRMATIPITYNTTGSFPKHRFQISKMLTHFFMKQRVIPRRIQNKYYNMIRKKLLERIALIKSRGSSNNPSNRTTKTFFNFTYKKYRFHFGIYTPCSFLLQDDNICDTPSPFIMSRDRTACCSHQKVFFNNISSTADKSVSTKPIIPKPVSSHNIVNNKIEHANRTFAKWTGSLTKKIFSNRLGISYDTSIKAVSHRELFYSSDNIPSPMYGKAFDNYQEKFSNSNSTKIRQTSRLNRLKNRVFRTNTTNPATNSRKKKSLMEKRHTLLRPNFRIVNTISHLRYKSNAIPKKNQYQYNIPFFSFSKECKDEMISYYKDSTRLLFCPPRETTQFQIHLNRNSFNIQNNPQLKLPIPIPRSSLNLENWVAHPPDVKIRPEQLPFVPHYPLFSRSGDLYYPPGSQEWRRHINRRLKKRLERTREREYNSGPTVIPVQTRSSIQSSNNNISEYFSNRKLERINELTLFSIEFHKGAATILTPSTDSVIDPDNSKEARWRDFYYKLIKNRGETMYIRSSRIKNKSSNPQTLKRSRPMDPLVISKRARLRDTRDTRKKIVSAHLRLHHVTRDVPLISTSSITPIQNSSNFTITVRNQISAGITKVDPAILIQAKTKRIAELTSSQDKFHKIAKKMINNFWDPQIKTKSFNKHVHKWLQFMETYNNDLNKFLKDNNDVYNRRPLDVQILKHYHSPDSSSNSRKRPKLLDDTLHKT